MARNGSGVMSVPNPDFVSGTVIESDKVDANFSTIVDEITNSIAADGQTTPTANLPMGGFKLTGLGSGSSATDSVHLRDVQYQAWAWCGTAGGTADDITLSPSPALGAYAAGQVFRWKAGSNANTTAMTVNISSLGQINIQNDGSALTGGEHAANAFYEGVLDTTNTMQLRRISGDFIGVDVQAYDAGLADIAGLAVTDSNIIVGDGSNWVAESGNTARTSLGLGTGNTPRFTGLILQDSDAGTAVGPVMKLHRNSASPAANDNLAQLKWTGEDSAGNEADYAEIVADILDPTNGSEDGRLRLVALVGGSAVAQLYVADGLFTPNATGGAQGQNTINVSDYYDDGVEISTIYVPRTADYDSGEQTVSTDTDLTLAHSLSAVPTRVEARLRCKSAEHGYSVGDEITINSIYSSTGADNGWTVFCNSTNVVVRQGNALSVLDASQNRAVITTSSWRWVVRAWS